MHAEVKDALVVAKNVIKDGSASDKRLVAYLVSEKAAADDTFAQNLNTELRLALSKVLPEHMLPASYVYLDAFPLTPNGKIDRKALPEADGIASGVDYVAPRTETEQQLAAIWQEVLGVERVGIHDNFFHLGGHSLLATRLVSIINQRFGKSISLKTIFEKPVIKELVKNIDDHASSFAQAW